MRSFSRTCICLFPLYVYFGIQKIAFKVTHGILKSTWVSNADPSNDKVIFVNLLMSDGRLSSTLTFTDSPLFTFDFGLPGSVTTSSGL